MKISEIKKLAEKVADNHVDCSDESIQTIALAAIRLTELILGWRGDFELELRESQEL